MIGTGHFRNIILSLNNLPLTPTSAPKISNIPHLSNPTKSHIAKQEVTMGRGSNWTREEETLLSKCFLHISEDAVVPTNQTSGSLYDWVVQEMKKRDNSFIWTSKAVKGKWMMISKTVQKFISCSSIVRSKEHSGWQEANYWKACVELYCKQTGQPTFPYSNEYYILWNHQKWITMGIDKKRPLLSWNIQQWRLCTWYDQDGHKTCEADENPCIEERWHDEWGAANAQRSPRVARSLYW